MKLCHVGVANCITTLILSESDAGKGDSPRPVSNKFYKEGERLFGPARLNLWPRDANGNLIESEDDGNTQTT